MPSHAIDMIIWDNSADNSIVASAVSPKGLVFLRTLTMQEDTSSVSILFTPEEFLQQIPPGLEVAFNREDGNLIKLDGVHPLQ